MTPAQRAAWLDRRRKGLGSSDIGAIFGLSPWAGPWQVWISKIHGIDDAGNNATITGQLLEEAVGKWAASRLKADGLMVAPEHVHPTRSWMRANGDYLLRFGDRHDGLECKVSTYPDESKGWGPDMSSQVPAAYESQVRWCMAVMDRPRWWLACAFLNAREWRIYRIERDADIERDMVERAEAWWIRHVVGREPPDTDGSLACARALAQAHNRAKGELRVADKAEEDAVRLYAKLDARIKHYEGHRAQLKNHLRQTIGDDEGIRFTGGFAKWHRPSNRLTVKIRD